MALLRSFRRRVRLLCIVVGVVGAIAVVLIMALVTAEVVGRGAMSRSILGANELVEYGMVVAVCVALGVAQVNKFHVRIDVLVSMLPARWRGAVDSVTTLLMLAFVGAVAWMGYVQAMARMARNVTSTLLLIPTWPFLIWLAIGWGVFFLVTLADFLLAVGGALGKEGEAAVAEAQEQLHVS